MVAAHPHVKAQTITLSTNVRIDVPVIPGTSNVIVPVNVLGSTVNLNVNVVGTPGGINLLPTNLTLPVNIVGRTLDLTLNVFPGTVPIVGGLPTINVPITVTLPTAVLAGAVSTLNAVAAVRHNDALLGLNMGLDRQIDLLAGPSDDAGRGWSEPAALGGMRLSGIAIDAFSAGLSGRGGVESDQISFATSLHQMRHANSANGPPYGLGAMARPPPPPKSAFDIWAEGSFSWFSDGSGSSERHGHWGVLYVGADYRLSRDVLIGTLVQFDRSSHEFETFASSARSSGWMAGPYATIRLSNNLFFQARAAWGKSNAELGLDSNPDDRFDAERWLVRGTLIGQWRSGPWQIRPRISVGYIEEHQEAYASSLGVTVPGQTLALGQVKAGPEIAYRYRLANDVVIEPRLLLEGIWNFMQEGGGLTIDDQVFGERVRGRAETGVMVHMPSGAGLGAALSYDGIGAGDYQAVAGKVRLRVPLN